MDESGKSLTKVDLHQYFTNSDPDGGGLTHTGLVSRMEWTDSVKSIQVVDINGTTLAQRDVSASRTGSKVTSPNGGEKLTITQPLKITWTGSDLDSDALTHSVSLSGDNGETWVPIAADIIETSFELPIMGLATAKEILTLSGCGAAMAS